MWGRLVISATPRGIVVVIARRCSSIWFERLASIVSGWRLLGIMVIKLPATLGVRMKIFAHYSVMTAEWARIVSMVTKMMLSMIVSRISISPVRLLPAFSERMRVRVSHRWWPIISGIIRMISCDVVVVELMVWVNVLLVFRIAIHLH